MLFLFVCFAVPIANGVPIDVWIQGENFEENLIFHDGSPFPTDIDTLLVWVTIQLKHAFEHVATAHLCAGIEVRMCHSANCVNTTVGLLFKV